MCFSLTMEVNLLIAQSALLTDIPNRMATSLDGKWQYIVDPYETGFYDYRYKELKQDDSTAYWSSDKPKDKTDLVEFGYNDKNTLDVPGDWNHQDKQFIYYEGTIWYRKSFDYTKRNGNDKVFLYFGAVNYRADVYLNGKKLGMHIGGFTPFDFEIPDSVLKEKNNYLVVRVNDTRHKDDVPTLNTDWWNYGGITRSVLLIEEPQTFVEDFFIHLKKGKQGGVPSDRNAQIEGWIQLDKAPANAEFVTVSIPELNFRKEFSITAQKSYIDFTLPEIQLWSPENPKLYDVIISTKGSSLKDKIGFRTVEAHNRQILLNGKPIFLRGIAIHEEIPQDVRRAWSKQDALQLLGQAKELGCNMVRLAHYPHDESMTRLADSLGFLVWSEIPVYWTIDFTSKEVYKKAASQLREMITRDHNRASIIVWSVGNETPVSDARTNFMHSLINTAHQLDSTVWYLLRWR